MRQFVDNRRAKIQTFVAEVTKRCPIPVECSIEGEKIEEEGR